MPTRGFLFVCGAVRVLLIIGLDLLVQGLPGGDLLTRVLLDWQELGILWEGPLQGSPGG